MNQHEALIGLPNHMWNLLRHLAMEDQVTTFLSSHGAQEVRRLCSEISVIAASRVVYTGSTRELGADLDTFEERRVELLTEEDANISSKTRCR
jgi:ABC-type multidrug transport system ATPase subunit